MAQREFLARDFVFEIDTSTGTPGTTWTEIGGINTWELKEEGKDADATDFSDNGYSSAMITGLKLSVVLKGNLNADGAARDPGQKACEAAARTFGPSGIKPFRISGPRGVVFGSASASMTFNAAVKLMGTGGGNEALMPWSVELLVEGEPTYAGFFAST
jgi:hypothetical protein